LIGGSAVAAHGRRPDVRVIGAEPAGADDAWRSFEAGEIVSVEQPDTIADGLRATLGELPFAVIRRHVETIVRVDDAAIVRAMRFVLERMKLVIEPSAAVPVAALLEGGIDSVGQRIGVLLSGGNIDLDRLPWEE
jgi:threonine dehydratase